MTTSQTSPPPEKTATRFRGVWIVLLVSLLYTLWLGSHWLPLPYSDKELAASASRVWDIKTELTEHHQLPWWTPNFMSGSSYAINHTRGFYLIPWLIFSNFTDLESAGKLMALLAIFASGISMYFCARHFLRHDWAAVLAGIAYLLHPEQIIRAAGAEHMTISLFFPFIPLLWLAFARMLESGQLRDIALCALTACFAMWTDNKQAVITFLYLGCYLIYWFWPKQRRENLAASARTFGLLAVFGLAMGVAIIVPGLKEMGYITLFDSQQLVEWQKGFAFKSLFGLVDRDGVVTKDLTTTVFAAAQHHQISSQAEYDKLRRIGGLTMDAPEKYTGLVFLALLAITALWNHRREKRRLFWFFIGMFLFSLMLANGFGSILSANMQTFDALSAWGGLPPAMWLAILALIAFLVIFARRKLTTQRKWLIAGGALAIFLLVPAFSIVANFPYFKDIRAPYSFYDGPGAFWVAILLAFFVTDVLTADKWRAHIPKIVAAVSVLLLLDYWPYQKPTEENGVPASTIQHLQESYTALKADKDWVKVYAVSGRYFHLLGPMYSGKPQVYEAFYNWQSPIGTGLLNAQAFIQTPDRHVVLSQDFLNLVGARYVVFDLASPGAPDPQSVLNQLSRTCRVILTNQDFVVFRNDNAHPYISATTQVSFYTGDLRKSAPLALALATRNYTLIYDSPSRVTKLTPPAGTEWLTYDDNSQPILPGLTSTAVPLQNLVLTRVNHQLVHIQLTAPQACMAVINESYYPFWHAEVDGQPANVFRVDCGLMGVEIGAGAHEIVLHYDPPKSYAICGMISGISLLACLGLIVVSTIRSSGANRPPA